jgi:hypothetical protein
MNCDPNALLEAARCFRCIPSGMLSSVRIDLICQWANIPSGTTCDPDAQKFLDYAQITDPIQSAAICALVEDLKLGNFWSKETAIYPIVGGTAARHAINLKDPGGIYDLTYSAAGFTHNALGMLGDGVNYADTGLKITTQNSGRVMVYVDARCTAANGVYWGCRDAGITIYTYFQFRGVATNANAQMNGASGATTAIEALGSNFIQRDSDASNIQYAYAANAWTSQVRASTGATNVTIKVLALGAAAFPSNARISGLSIGSPISGDSELAAYRAIWDKYETALGRGHP